MVRLALANGFRLHPFYANLLDYRAPVWSRDIDRHPAPALLALLGRQTGQPVATLRALTLDRYAGLLFESVNLAGNTPWILPVGVFHRLRRHGAQYCPLCLRADPIPYHRRPWRLALYVLCEFHGGVLRDSCPACGSPLAYHRCGIGRHRALRGPEALRFCPGCQFDLGQAPLIDFRWPDAGSWRALQALVGGFERGVWFCGPLTPPCAVPFFQGLHVLANAIRGRNGAGLRVRLGERFGVRFPASPSDRHVEFEYLSAIERLKLLLAAIWLLEDWPARFVALCADARFTRSRMAEEVKALPFWLASITDSCLDRRLYLPAEQEIMSAGAYLQAHQQRVTPAALKGLLGLSKENSYSAWRIWKRLFSPKAMRLSPDPYGRLEGS